MGARTSTKILNVLAGADGLLTTKVLADCTGLDTKQVGNSTALLIRHGLIEREGTGRFRVLDKGRDFLIADEKIVPGPAGPHGKARRQKESLRARAWAAMRAQGKFTIGGLVEVAVKGKEEQPHANIGAYVRKLEAAGYLSRLPRRQVGTAPTSNGFIRYLLIENTGPKAPIWRPRQGVLFDPNTKAEIDPASTSEPKP